MKYMVDSRLFFQNHWPLMASGGQQRGLSIWWCFVIRFLFQTISFSRNGVNSLSTHNWVILEIAKDIQTLFWNDTFHVTLLVKNLCWLISHRGKSPIVFYVAKYAIQNLSQTILSMTIPHGPSLWSWATNPTTGNTYAWRGTDHLLNLFHSRSFPWVGAGHIVLRSSSCILVPSLGE